MSATRRGAVVALVAALVLMSACSRGDSGPEGQSGPVVLDGRPRLPDVEGVMTSVSTKRVTIDKHRYELSRTVQAFSSSTQKAVSLLGRKDQYVQVGLHGRQVQWIAVFSSVVHLPARPAVAYHLGQLIKADALRATFADGSVLRLASGIALPPRLPLLVQAEIDPAAHRVVRVVPLAT